jgi:multidrug efflux pump subunit AcrA (membrane-fusion protein)
MPDYVTMVREITSHDAVSDEPAWDDIQSALEQIALLATSNLAPRDFHAALIAKTGAALSAVGGAIWLRTADGSLACDAADNFDPAALDDPPGAPANHQHLLEAVLARGAACSVPPGQALDRAPAEMADPRVAWPINSTDFLLAFAPLRLGAETIGLAELLFHDSLGPKTLHGHVQFLAAVCELAADFHRQQQLRQFAAREGHWRQLEQFIEAAHESLDLRTAAYAIANEGRRLVGCDRLSVAVANEGGCRVTAISGSETIETRSNLVRRLEELGERVLVLGEPVWYPAPPDSLAPEIERPLDACLDESHARVLGVLPLKRRQPGTPQAGAGEPIGLIFVEQFQASAVDPALGERAAAVGRHATSALASALEYESLPLLKLERGLQQLRWLTRLRQLPKSKKILLSIAAVGLALVLLPANFDIEARGELQPRVRRELFAPSDGIISEVRAVEGREVQAGDELVSLRKPQLEFELHRVLGDAQTARKRLAAVQAARLGPERGKSDAAERYNQLTAEEEELKELLASLSQQEQILRGQQDELVLTSPIAGQVLTWNVEQLLAARPVERGQKLLTVGDLNGPWELELRLPDDHAGYVLAAQRTRGSDLEVAYLLATDPGTAYHGHIEKTSLATQTDEVYGSHLRLTVGIDADRAPRLRPGATVIGKIHCGRRSLAFVWLHDLIAMIRSRLLF